MKIEKTELPAAVQKFTPELLICGAGITGCLAALAAAEDGRKVAVLEKRSYPGREVAAYDHSFIRRGSGDRALRMLPQEIQRLFSIIDDEGILAPEAFVRQGLLRMLEKRNIPVLFEAEPAALASAGRTVNGVIAAAPPGVVRIPAAAVLDATERAQVVRLAKGVPYLPAGRYTVHAVFEWELAPAGRPAALALPPGAFSGAAAEPGILEGSVRLHTSVRTDTVVTEFAFEAEVADPSPHSLSRLEEQRQELSLRLAAWMRKHIGLFAEASLSFLAYECRPEGHELPEGCDSGFDNLFALPALPWNFSPDDLAAAWNTVRETLSALPRTPAPAVPPEREYRDDALPVSVELMEPSALPPPALTLPCDVCVVGLGTAGGTAMAAAAERGASVIAAEQLQLPGGTFSPGLVAGLYGGYRGGAFERYRSTAEQQRSAELHTHGAGGVAYIEYLRNAAALHGAVVCGGTRLCGAKRTGNRVTELLFANESGFFAIAPRITIDATGNADVAAFAGAEFDLGAPDDGMMQSYSMWGTESVVSGGWGCYRYNSDPDVVSPVPWSERLRAISLGHRDNSCHHIAPMATVREGRRIRGERALLLNDILNRKLPEDVFTVATTSCDSHAHLSSSLAAFSIIGNGAMIRVRIPFGCFIPRTLDGLLVGAKALSGERDATSLCRMNADIVNQGYALGCAAAAALAAGGDVRAVDLASMQAELRETGILPDWAFRHNDGEKEAVPAEILAAAGIDRLSEMLTFSAAEAVPLLEKRRNALPPEMPEDPLASDRAAVSLALAWYGSAAGSEFLKEQLAFALAEKRHLAGPHMKPERLRLQDRRDSASDFFQVNRLIVMAGLSGAGGFGPLLKQLIDETPGLGEPVARLTPYDVSRKDVPVHPFYRRLSCLAFTAERRPDPLLADALDALIRRSGVSGHAVPAGSDAAPSYMLAYLELRLARAACRCGSRFGAGILAAYANDVHSIFRESARQLLRETAKGDVPADR